MTEGVRECQLCCTRVAADQCGFNGDDSDGTLRRVAATSLADPGMLRLRHSVRCGGTMSRSSRWSSAVGIVFVALFVFGTLSSIDSPDIKSKDTSQIADQKWLHYLSSSSHRTQHVIGAYALILAGIAFVWFCNGLRNRIDGMAGASVAGRTIAGLSVFGAAALAAAGMTSADIPGSVSLGTDPLPSSGDVAREIGNLTFPFIYVVFALVSAALIATVIVTAKRTGALPNWLIYTGWLAVLGGLAAVIFLPMILVALWYLALAIAGVATSDRAAEASPSTA
jgi:hypothetical protein